MKEECTNCEYLYKEYVLNGRSTKSIAAEHNTFPNTIRRALKKCGFDIRDKSTAQKQFIENNGGSPLLGRKRSTQEKEAIAAGIQDFWDNIDETRKQDIKARMAESAKRHWQTLTENEKKDAVYKMHLASKSKMYQGSKNENLVASLLTSEGFRIEQRASAGIPGRQFEIDIGIPEKRVAIEWDGATHFLPIYGEEHLEKVLAKDAAKNRLLIGAGWHVIRCRDYSTSSTKAFCKRAVLQIKEAIEIASASKQPTLTLLDME